MVKASKKNPIDERASRRGPFQVGGQAIAAGTAGHLEIPVARLPTGGWQALPISVIHGAKDGPTCWLSAAIHGDELNGVAIIRNVLRAVQPQLLAGTLITVPVVNVFGLMNESRYLPDRRDLNRCFPGSKRGSLAAQLAHLFMQEVVQRCEFGIDLHTGSGGRANLPQIRCDLDDPRTRTAALAFAPPVVLHASLRDGSLRAAARDLGVPVLLFECGEARRFDVDGIRLGTVGCLRVLVALGLLDDWPGSVVPSPGAPPFLSYRSHWERARRGGFCEMKTKLGEFVEEGKRIAEIFDASGREQVTVRSSTDGVVIGQVAHALVHRGEAIAHIAEVDRPPEA